MNAEKMKILSMLEQGKITAEEASKLLQSIGNSDASASDTSRSSASSSYSSGSTYAGNNQQRPRSESSANFDDYARDFGRKIETLARDLEPKIQKLAEVVVEKTASYADKVSKTMNEASKQNANTSNANRDMLEKSFEMAVGSGYNELNLAGFNGSVTIKGYNGDKISAKIFYKQKRAGAPIELIQLGNKYYLNYDEDDFRAVSVDALIPESLFTNVTLQTTNAKMDIATIRAENILIASTNAKIEVRDVQAEVLKIESSNGKLELGNIKCAYAQMETSNAAIRADLFDISKMKVITCNAAVHMTVASLDRYDEYTWAIETSNGKLSINTPTSPEHGYHLRAQTSLSNVRFGLTGLNYIVNEPNHVEARSIQYDSARKKIDLNLETSNGTISVE